MAVLDEEDRREKPVRHAVGEDLSALSLAELQDRIALLADEIKRLEAAVSEKSASRSAAQSAFRI